MSDLEKGKSEKGKKSAAAPPAKKDAKPDNSWSKIPLAIAIFLMVVLIIRKLMTDSDHVEALTQLSRYLSKTDPRSRNL
ncbi:uncharacterized protein PGTG_21051 [Puccinia graminis f. sp. tritici CRL 75-36-700-3]|uniref:Uncharacterized protein n=1 Tax=Puccinia graminis f. sp. tritici (strain CRL 75-36-700-3 / race SCCL) TaxID=418459 RepID=H6QQ99_PUCGT|nr:uncharacterized protein PGTG_21051 [Puccinia graminis f. sp. tritici CRL 75-36-700-3]EHS64791.1 hypothetical protein PGTG_21051 [Puccinia graminis f. sp. tritici CRL 75-36-700-3]